MVEVKKEKPVLKNCWIYLEDFTWIANHTRYGKRFADGVRLVVNEIKRREAK